MTARSVADIVAVLELGADDFDAGGERAGFSLLDHGLQCADNLRLRFPADLELQVAGLVHDIGQTMTGNDELAHGVAAGAFIRPVLGDRVALLVELHVPAKRYLVTVDDGYLAQLSPASRESLAHQGATMTADEVAEFERLQGAAFAVALRRADDDAKDPAALPSPLSSWLPVLHEVASRVHAAHDGGS